jgi:hypothetical protein
MTCSWDGSLRIWNVKTGNRLENTGERAGMNTIALSPDGKKYLAGVVTVRRSEVVGHRHSQGHR